MSADEQGADSVQKDAHRQILFVGEDKEKSVPQLVLVEHALQFLAGFDHTITIIAVDDEDDTLGVLEIMPPQRPDLILPANIPHGELNVLVFDGLNIEACRERVDQQGALGSMAGGRAIPMVGMVVTISPNFNL